jgi:hypothetical protein
LWRRFKPAFPLAFHPALSLDVNSDWRKTMIRRILLLGLLLSLAACETTQLDRDFDSSRDFAAYRSWSWSQPAFEYRPDDPPKPSPSSSTSAACVRPRATPGATSRCAPT